MSKYINADHFIYEMKHHLWDWESVDGIMASTVLRQTITDIKNEPSADVVEVVRCKDCMWYGVYDEPIYHCIAKNIRFPVLENEFCGRGERKKLNEK